MGSPLSPILSNLVMEDLEIACLAELPFSTPFYVRYVDDILIAIPSDCLELVLRSFNSYHPRLQFTAEQPIDNKISFLDITIINNTEKCITDWYHKPTWSRKYLNFNSHHPIKQKIGVIFGLVDRSILLSDPSFHLKNLSLVREVLIENNYPDNFVDTYVMNRLKTLEDRANETPNIDDVLVNIPPVKFCFPYVKGLSQSVSRTLRPYNVSCVFKNVNDLSHIYSSLKDKTSLPFTSNVVYKIPCGGCQSSYIGQTGRWLKTRLNEHDKNVNRKEKEHTALTKHKINFDHQFKYDKVEVLYKEKNERKRIIHEMCHIVRDNTAVNLRTDVDNLCASYFGLL